MKAKLTFEQWMKQVDFVLYGFGLAADDLPDCPYRDWFDDGLSVGRAVKRAIKNAQEF